MLEVPFVGSSITEFNDLSCLNDILLLLLIFPILHGVIINFKESTLVSFLLFDLNNLHYYMKYFQS